MKSRIPYTCDQGIFAALPVEYEAFQGSGSGNPREPSGPVQSDARAKSEEGRDEKRSCGIQPANGRLIDRRHRCSAPQPNGIIQTAGIATPSAWQGFLTSSHLKKDIEGRCPRAAQGIADARLGRCPRPSCISLYAAGQRPTEMSTTRSS